MYPDIFCQIPAGHPFRNKLGRSKSDTEERHDVLVLQVFPRRGRVVECLWIPLETVDRESSRITHFCSLIMIVLSACPDALDTNPRTIE